MQNQQRKINWAKWIDPFDEVDEKNINNDEELEDDDEDFDEDDEELEEYNSNNDFDNDSSTKKSNKKINGPVLVGPMGIIPVNEHNKPSKIYNFWMAHTNFSISRQIKKIIENTDGVETLDIFTRYRARIGIGKAFNANEVKENINSVLCPKMIIKESSSFKDYLSSKYKVWMIGIQENGKMDIFNGNRKDLEILSKKYKKSYKSWENQ